MLLKLSLILLKICAILAIAVDRNFLLNKPFYGPNSTTTDWDALGSVMMTINYIRLTPDEKSQIGAIWAKNPCNVRYWEVVLNFKIAGSSKMLFGDGMAFWYVKDRMIPGKVFGSKDYFSGLGIFIDTYLNSFNSYNRPYVSGMINNGSLSYNHNIDGTDTELAGCEAIKYYRESPLSQVKEKFRNVNHDTLMKIRYENDILKVATSFEESSVWKECFAAEVKLPVGYYFGVSAMTGDVSDAHLIYGLNFKRLSEPVEWFNNQTKIVPEGKSPPIKEKKIKQNVKIIIFFIMLASTILLVSLGIFIFISIENYKAKKAVINDKENK